MELATGRVDIMIINPDKTYPIHQLEDVEQIRTEAGYVGWRSDDYHAAGYKLNYGDTAYVTARTIESKFEVGDEVQFGDEVDGYSYGVVSEPFWDGEVKYRVSTYARNGYPMPRPSVFTETELALKPEGV